MPRLKMLGLQVDAEGGVEAQDVDAEAVNAEAVVAEAVNAEAVIAEAVNAEAVMLRL